MFQESTSKVVLIDEIDPVFNRYEIRVRILKLWRGFKTDSGSSLEMVLIDEQGTRIHATVEDKLISKHQKVLKEDLCVSIDTFKLVTNGFEYKTSPQSYKIGFFRTTLVTPYDDFPNDVPEKYFVGFSDIRTGVMDPKMLVDVIGRITSVGPVEDITVRGRQATKLDIELQDLTGVRLSCTLWGNYADQVKTYTDAKDAESIVCILRLAQVKEFRGNWSISNAFSATKILLDPQNQFAEEFRSKLVIDADVQVLSSDKSPVLTDDTVSLYDEFFVINDRKTILEIVTSNEAVTCVTVATVDKLVDPYRWCYLTCKLCKKKVQPYPQNKDYNGPPSYDCEKCDKVVTDVTAKYRIMLGVSDGSAMTKFLLFDIIAQNLLNKSADELMLEVSQDDPRKLPSVLAALVGKKILFKIVVDAKNKQTMYSHYVVKKYCDSPNMVEEFISGRVPTVVAEDVRSLENDVVEESLSDSTKLSSVIAASKKNKSKNGTNVTAAVYTAKKKIKVEKDK